MTTGFLSVSSWHWAGWKSYVLIASLNTAFASKPGTATSDSQLLITSEKPSWSLQTTASLTVTEELTSWQWPLTYNISVYLTLLLQPALCSLGQQVQASAHSTCFCCGTTRYIPAGSFSVSAARMDSTSVTWRHCLQLVQTMELGLELETLLLYCVLRWFLVVALSHQVQTPCSMAVLTRALAALT